MKILAFQGSSNTAGFTQMLLDNFLKGATIQGAEHEIIQLSRRNIHPCTGCLCCWTIHPGICKIKDDMPELIEKVKNVNVIIQATPLHSHTMSSHLKVFISRVLPMFLPDIEKPNNGPSRFMLRNPERTCQSMVLISGGALPDLSNFNGLVETFRHQAHSFNLKIGGILLRPSVNLLEFVELLGQRGQDVLNAFYRAGEELVINGYVSKTTEEAASRTLVRDLQSFIDENKVFWSMKMDYERRRAQGEQLPGFKDFFASNLWACMKCMADNLNPEVAGDLRATIQFEVSGKQSGNWYFSIGNGRCTLNDGCIENPTLMIRTSSEVWLDVINGKLDPQQALIEGKYTAVGDVNLLLRLKKIFS